MPIQHAVWTVADTPVEVPQGVLPSEQRLEDMIVAEPRILSSEWMLIGRQVDTGLGGRIDLLAIAPDGTLVLVELKRNRTPREVVAQALDYASSVEHLDAEEIAAIYGRFRPQRSLVTDFAANRSAKILLAQRPFREGPSPALSAFLTGLQAACPEV
jgi:RecB family endonuclease NucS